MPAPLRLLVAEEDSAVRRRLLTATSGLEGVLVSGAASPPALVESVCRQRPDLVYIGMTRPGGQWTRSLARLQRAGHINGALVVVDAERSETRLRHIVGAVLAASGRGTPRPTRTRTVDRLAIPTAGRIAIVRVEDVCWVEGAGTYVRLHTDGESLLLRESMRRLAERLDARQFVRIHRSAIVNVDCVRALEHEARGEYRVYLQDGTDLKLTRSYRHHLGALTGVPFPS